MKFSTVVIINAIILSVLGVAIVAATLVTPGNQWPASMAGGMLTGVGLPLFISGVISRRQGS